MVASWRVTFACAVVLASCTRGPEHAENAGRPTVVAAASAPPKGDARRAAPRPVAPVVAIVVDQLSAWVAEERVALLPDDGFFRRLTREGTWARTMRYPYATTDTAPGHASLHTGRVPAETRIVLNEVPDATTGARTSYFRDPSTKLITPDGPVDAAGSSAAKLAVATVADRLRHARPNARIISISLKDRAALIPAGKKPSAALWFDPSRGSFVTSTAVATRFPSWAREKGDATAIAALRTRTWEPLDTKWLAEHAGRDDAPGEGDLDGLGIVFPHRIPSARAFRATPMSDERILDLALDAVAAEDDPVEPLLLLLSLSASDVIGHTFGPSSWEAWDHLRRLDASLARFVTTLEQRVGPVRIVLSGDHGNVTMPEARVAAPGCREDHGDRYDRPACTVGGRLEPFALGAELRAEAEKALGRPDLVAGVCDGYVFLSAAGRALPEPKRKALDAVVMRVLVGNHGANVAEVIDARELAKTCPSVLAGAKGVPERALPGEDLRTLVCRSWTDGAGAGDYYVVPRHGSFFDGEVVAGKGTSHGTPWLYDRTVPLFVRDGTRSGGVDAGVAFDDPIDFSAYAAIESAWLGLDARTPREILSALRARP